MDDYCEMLIHAGLVNRGKKGPEMSREVWLEFLRDVGICPEPQESNIGDALAEPERGFVDINNLKAVKDESTNRTLLFLKKTGK
jgi:hypothetical protein